MPRKYLDFDLLIERAGSGYRARVLDSPSGQAAVEFTLPFSALEMDNFLLKVTRSLGDARRNLRRLETPERQLIKGFGSKLFDAVFTAGVQDTLQGSLNEAYRRNAGLRVRLRLTEAPELADIPWEFLHNPVANQFLSLNPDTPLVRYLDLPVAGRPLAVTPPLKVLVMISSPSDFPQLDVAAEWDRLNASLHDLIEREVVTLTRLPSGSLASLSRPLRLSQYHIFHFVGHGGFDEQSQDGALVLEDEDGRGRLVSGQDLGVMLSGHRSLRLVILNACEGARSSASDPFAGVAQTLIQQAIPAVVAMQFEITDDAAITFAHEFYGAVADGYPVDAAVAESRRAIFARGNEFEWGTPVLYMRSPNGQLFRLTRDAVPPLRDEGEGEQQEREQQEREQQERERVERERVEHEQQEREQQERERVEREQQEREQKERERVERERVEREQQERERVERERVEREQQERERVERERVEHEQQEREQKERERVERERVEREQQERERVEREQQERERVEAIPSPPGGRMHRQAAQLHTSRPASRTAARRMMGYVLGFLALDAALVVGAYGAWGPGGKLSAFERSTWLLVGTRETPQPVPWFTSIGVVLLVLAAGLAWAAIGRRRLVLGLLGGASVVCSMLFVRNASARALSLQLDNPYGGGWGTWVVIGAGLGIVILSLLSAFMKTRGGDNQTAE